MFTVKSFLRGRGSSRRPAVVVMFALCGKIEQGLLLWWFRGVSKSVQVLLNGIGRAIVVLSLRMKYRALLKLLLYRVSVGADQFLRYGDVFTMPEVPIMYPSLKTLCLAVFP